jgi:hypothetical protein
LTLLKQPFLLVTFLAIFPSYLKILLYNERNINGLLGINNKAAFLLPANYQDQHFPGIPFESKESMLFLGLFLNQWF